MAVEPARSQNTTVTVRRCSPAFTDRTPSEAPHSWQYFAASRLAWPQLGQAIMTAEAKPRLCPGLLTRGALLERRLATPALDLAGAAHFCAGAAPRELGRSGQLSGAAFVPEPCLAPG